MKFHEALDSCDVAECGEDPKYSIRRKSWPKGAAMYLNDEEEMCLNDIWVEELHALSREDFNAQDWEVVPYVCGFELNQKDW